MKDPDFTSVFGGQEEVRCDASYFFENRDRPNLDQLVIQRTMSGEGFFEDGAGRRRVGAEEAMLFTHREDSRYGFPSGRAEPYRLRFLSLVPTRGLRALFDRIRRDFGAVVAMRDGAASVAMFDELLDRFRGRRFDDRWQETELAHGLLIALHREQATERSAGDAVERGRQILLNRFRAPLTVARVAEDCGLSREHFIRAYRARHGETPGVVLRRLRLGQARSLLAASRLTVEEVALACGFASVDSFGRAFRAAFGRSPSASRGGAAEK